MSKHLFGIICTHHGSAANNRGETEGNITTLQKLLWNGAVHTTVSAEAIRWAVRHWWQEHGIATNRSWDDDEGRHTWKTRTFDIEQYIDDDVLGFMSAEAAKAEGNDAEGEGADNSKGKSKNRQKGTSTARRSRLEITRAISLTAWGGDMTFNAASRGATPSAAMKGDNPVPYGTELHATRYQYGFSLTPESLADRTRAVASLDALIDLATVAGNHARFLYDFSPESIVLRWTDDFAPRMLYGFNCNVDGVVGITKLVSSIQSGDIPAAEVLVGGAVASTPDGILLAKLGAATFDGVKEAAREVANRMRVTLGIG